jgi:hypothetical protein|tara:strand:+ start:563 stop:757 length:195 start_codon:yes stop_codon:yes gene_type:complete
MKNDVNSGMKTKEKSAFSELSQGKYVVIYPDDMELDEVAFIKNKIFRLLERHSCTIKKVENETG